MADVESSGKAILIIIIAVALAFFVASALMPTAIGNIYDANTTGWDAEATDLWDMLPVIGILTIFLALLALGLSMI